MPFFPWAWWHSFQLVQKGMHGGDGINPGFEGTKGKKALECNVVAENADLVFRGDPDTDHSSTMYQLSDIE